MLYRVMASLPFISETDAQALFTVIKAKIHKASKLPQIGAAEEATFVEIHKCYHDESLIKPCEVIERIEV